ncbi:hypothetical protein HA402_014147 [Bradysia odoriphaga]|nr:hypothetical protein HA402_014147 [Bradysia odoriphaga]
MNGLIQHASVFSRKLNSANHSFVANNTLHPFLTTLCCKMMNVSTLTVLLVCVILECAHSFSFERGWERFSPRSKRSTENKVSVVESWDSVCEEVCRAGYGGLGCGTGCNAQISTGYSDKFDKICPNLCENNLGKTKCSCESSPVNPNLPTARNSLCSATCGWRTSLSGCSKCFREDVGTTDGGDLPTTTDEITDEYGTTNTTGEEGTVTEEYSTDEEDTTTDEYSTDEEDTTTDEYSTDEEDTTTDEYSTTDSNEDDSTTEEATTTISTTTTTQPTTTTRTTTQATTTTPNWESMCEALCRNGEGGSLCNCDIPPFF